MRHPPAFFSPYAESDRIQALAEAYDRASADPALAWTWLLDPLTPPSDSACWGCVLCRDGAPVASTWGVSLAYASPNLDPYSVVVEALLALPRELPFDYGITVTPDGMRWLAGQARGPEGFALFLQALHQADIVRGRLAHLHRPLPPRSDTHAPA